MAPLEAPFAKRLREYLRGRVIVAGRKFQKAQVLAQRLGERVEPMQLYQVALIMPHRRGVAGRRP
jgi:glutamyl-tRNA reductase